MKKVKIGASLVVVSLLVIGCLKDIQIVDLAKETVRLNAPAAAIATPTLTHQFWWEELEGADGYVLQIVTPRFDSIVTLILDSSLTMNTFSQTFTPGNYEWSVRAYNASSSTNWVTRSLTILNDSLQDLANQVILIDSPQGPYYESTSVDFIWFSSAYAEEYQFELHSPSIGGAVIVAPLVVTDTSYTVANLDEGTYQWVVRGQNDNSITGWAGAVFQIDTASPGAPTLITPADQESIYEGDVTFSWTRAADTGTPLRDSIYFGSDSVMTSILSTLGTSSSNFTDSLSEGVYYWQVRSFDAVDHEGTLSDVRKLTVNIENSGG